MKCSVVWCVRESELVSVDSPRNTFSLTRQRLLTRLMFLKMHLAGGQTVGPRDSKKEREREPYCIVLVVCMCVCV